MFEYESPAQAYLKQLIQPNPVLARMTTLEPAMHSLFVLATEAPGGGERWKAYEILKRAIRRYVGWEATNPELQSSEVYDEAIKALGDLMPDSEDSFPEDVEQKVLVMLRDGVMALCPTLQLPDWCWLLEQDA